MLESLFAKPYPFYELIVFFTISQLFIIVTAYVTLPYKNLTQWQNFSIAIPYAWISRVFLTHAMNIENKYHFLGPNNTVFLLIVTQFFFIMVGNRLYLGEKTSRSEIIAFFILMGAYAISNYNLASKALNIPVVDGSGNIISGPGSKPASATGSASPSKTHSYSASITQKMNTPHSMSAPVKISTSGVS